MATAELVEAKVRQEEERGKGRARRLRRSGSIPAVVYGARKQALAVTVDPKQISRILHSESGHNTIFDLQVGEERAKVMIVDWQYEPIKGALLHIDMKRIAMDQRMRVRIPLELKGEAPGVKQQGGIIDHVLREVEVECLPGDIPGHIDVDISQLAFGHPVRVSDLPQMAGVKYVTETNQMVAHITAVKEEEPAAVEPGLEVPAVTEPELIRKGKAVEEEAAAEGAEKKPEKKGEKREKEEKR